MFTIDADLPRTLYPLAWLVGSWRGYGSQVVPDGDDRMIIQEITFTAQGEELLQTTTTYAATPKEGSIPVTATAREGEYGLEKGEQLWQEEARWQVRNVADSGSGPVQASIEVSSKGHPMVSGTWDGMASGPRISIKLASDTAAPAKASRMFGLVNSELFWTQDVARGDQGGTDFSGRLAKVENAD